MSQIKGIKIVMNPINIEVPVTPILIGDKNAGGFTAYFKEFPNIVSEGESQEEAVQNLTNTVFDVFKYKNTLPE